MAMDEYIINGGTNELKTESLHEFVYTVHKAGEKLQQIVTAGKKVTLVLPQVATATPEAKAKSIYLQEQMQSITEIKTVCLSDIEYDDTDHPTVNGTRELIKQIHSANNNDIIMDGCDDDTVSKRIYRKVQTAFKVGCRGCNSTNFTNTLCEECKVAALEVNIGDLEVSIATVREQMYPAMNDVEMRRENNKRSLDDNLSHDDLEKERKSPKGSA